jgi:tetratricopeptide (TPR) repeat protein
MKGAVTVGRGDPSAKTPREVFRIDRFRRGGTEPWRRYIAGTWALLQAGRIDEAIASSGRGRELYPNEPEAHLACGEALVQGGRFKEAIAAARRALDLAPGDDPSFYAACGDILGNAGAVDEAIAVLDRARALDPDDTETHALCDKILRHITDLKKVGESKKPGYTEDALPSSPATVRSAAFIGPATRLERGGRAALVWNADDPAATAELEANAPLYMVAFFEGYQRGVAGEYEQAARLFRQVITEKPDYASAHYNLGVTLREQGREATAIAAFRRAIRLRPDFSQAHLNLGALLADKGQRRQATRHFEKIFEIEHRITQQTDRLHPATELMADAQFNLGFLAEKAADYETAAFHYLYAANLDPELTRSFFNLGVAQAKLGKIAEAISAFGHVFEKVYDPEERSEIAEFVVSLIALPSPIDESNTSRYTSYNMSDMAAYFAVARRAFEKGLSVAELDEAIDDKLAAKAATREITARATAEPRPDEPAPVEPVRSAVAATPESAELAWPTEKWKGSPEEVSRKPHAIFAFLRRVWKPFIEDTGALVTRQILLDHDTDAGIAVRNALRVRKGMTRKPKMPDDIPIIRVKDLKTTVSNRRVTYANLHI